MSSSTQRTPESSAPTSTQSPQPTGSILSYLREHYISVLVLAASGVLLGTASVSVPPSSWFAALLLYDNIPVLTSVGAALGLLILASTNASAQHFRKLGTTLRSTRPPQVWLVSACIALAGYGATAIVFTRLDTASLPASSLELRVLVACLVSLYAVVVAIRLLSARTSPNASETSASFTYHNDEPISEADDDLLHRGEFVRKITERVLAVPIGTPFTLAISGPWGAGKTSVLSMIAVELRNRHRIVTIPFNPWLYASAEAMTLAFWRELQIGLSSRFLGAPRFANIRRYARVISYGASALRFPALPAPESSLSEMQRDIDEWLVSTGTTVVILVDDIDRLDERQMRTVIGLSAGSGRLRSVVFLLSMDYDRVAKALGGHPFLDRVVQELHHLPAAPYDAIDRFFLYSTEHERSKVDELFDRTSISDDARREFGERFVTVYRKHCRRLMPTLRHVKRLLNSLEFALPHVALEVDVCDFVLLEILRLHYPRVYSDIRDRPWYYLRPANDRLFWDSPGHNPFFDQQERKTLVKEHMKSLVSELSPDQPSEPLIGILTELFPEPLQLFTDRAVASPVTPLQAEKQARICDPQSFDTYFTHRPTEQTLTHAAVAAILDLLAEPSNQDQLARAVDSLLAEHRESDSIPELLKKLALIADDLPESTVRELLTGTARASDAMSGDLGANVFELYRHVVAPTLHIAQNGINAADQAASLRDMISASSSLFFSVVVVHALKASGNSVVFHSLVRHSDVDQLKSQVVDQIREFIANSPTDLFSTYTHGAWRVVLFQWATDWDTLSEEYRTEATRYLLQHAARRLDLIHDYLQGFEEKGLISGTITLDTDKLERAGDMTLLRPFLIGNRATLEQRGLWRPEWHTLITTPGRGQ